MQYHFKCLSGVERWNSEESVRGEVVRKKPQKWDSRIWRVEMEVQTHSSTAATKFEGNTMLNICSCPFTAFLFVPVCKPHFCRRHMIEKRRLIMAICVAFIDACRPRSNQRTRRLLRYMMNSPSPLTARYGHKWNLFQTVRRPSSWCSLL